MKSRYVNVLFLIAGLALVHSIVDFYFLVMDTSLSPERLYWLISVNLINKSIIAGMITLVGGSLLLLFTNITSIKNLFLEKIVLGVVLLVYLGSFWLQFGRFYWFPGTAITNTTVLLWISGLVIGTIILSFLLVTSISIPTYYHASLFGLLILVVIIIPWYKGYSLPPRGEISGNPPNVFFLLIDTLHADHLSNHGYKRPTAPNLTKFSKNAFQFDRAYAASNWTKPSVASIFSGMHPYQHGANLTRSILPSGIPTLPELLRQRGYQTSAVSSNSLISAYFGFNQGVEDFTLLRASRLNGDGTYQRFLSNLGLNKITINFESSRTRDDARDVNRAGWQWIKNEWNGHSPFFQYLHYMDPHDPYDPPKDHLQGRKIKDDYDYQEYKKKYLPGSPKIDIFPFYKHKKPPKKFLGDLVYQYDAEIRYWDHEFGQFIEQLKQNDLFKNSLIIVTADHGEEFFQHHNWSHGQSVFDENIHVPLLIKLPNQKENYQEFKATSEPVNNVKLNQFLLKWAGKPSQRSNLDNFYFWDKSSREDTAIKPVYSSKVELSNIEQFSLVDFPWKIHKIKHKDKTAWRLYNLSKDPAEKNDLKKEESKIFTRLQNKLKDRIENARKNRYDASTQNLTPEMREDLKGLGYLN